MIANGVFIKVALIQFKDEYNAFDQFRSWLTFSIPAGVWYTLSSLSSL